MGSQGSRGAAVDGIAGAIGEIVDALFSKLLLFLKFLSARSSPWRRAVLYGNWQ
jgi:hypothetical protein